MPEAPIYLKGPILIVDNMLDILEPTAILFRQDGYEVYTASSYKEAIALYTRLKINGRLPQVALLDAYLGDGASGFELAKSLRSLDKAHSTALFIWTAYDKATAQTLAIDCGVEKVIKKPADLSVLVEEIDKGLGYKAKRRELEAPSVQHGGASNMFIGGAILLAGLVAWMVFNSYVLGSLATQNKTLVDVQSNLQQQVNLQQVYIQSLRELFIKSQIPADKLTHSK